MLRSALVALIPVAVVLVVAGDAVSAVFRANPAGSAGVMLAVCLSVFFALEWQAKKTKKKP